ncbi:apoptosis-inducing factor homolog A-like [Vigna radiata var. radiata]|uniref:Apoptosis-inducing factor homolog A-like n=1 Tax=Vigna radiata var. radiata TaxID=3916 RepID=A0A1S3TKD0_VIGRR|nr:apoptosis-inducing factor homolog A-like [Vigna radiata var. radiata]
MAEKKVVIVGGGVAGATLAKNIQNQANVTLIDPKEYFEIPWASLRGLVEPSFAERIVINHREYFKKGDLVVSSAVNITETEVFTADGQQIAYDYLVIATGHAEPIPKTRTERLDQYKAENAKIKSASSILIVGGGPTGVELAAEIAVDFPDKKVTIVHKGVRLLEYIGQKASSKTLKWLKSKKVDVKLEQSVEVRSSSEENKTYETSNGETIEADAHFLCIGKPVGSAWLRETLLKDDLDGDGRIKVDENLRVKGRSNIFAIGDITDVQEIKQGVYASGHAQLVAKNLKLLIEGGGKENKLGTYKAQPPISIVSLGRKTAVAQFPFITVLGRLPGMIKSGDLFVGKTRKDLGLEPNVKKS